jgi:hypothetical protein
MDAEGKFYSQHSAFILQHSPFEFRSGGSLNRDCLQRVADDGKAGVVGEAERGREMGGLKPKGDAEINVIGVGEALETINII